ncbi:hypothetical protein AM493_17495 [Flavobacterium akiainvivens]|uniref:Uncharacterized protein n=1 Tax=Flavobacterium akiainvivens TaxID=1202724 RepID=A0A0M9VJD7_9FLAO|nr:hypothetical protein [Flavobacterium akiainvivens]KOS07636.1 hypothetical protein AM493_17495 [Flavobacterium akiainvivens]SFQ23197.1 hypothetical protein SAMN05444144_10279 [Flavobacterium akiainvivens]
MKYIHYINFFALGITLLLYVTLFLGMFAQLILGSLQLLLAAIITIAYYEKLNERCKKLLLRYWAFALAAVFIALVTWLAYEDNTTATVLFIFVIPMCVACYFVYVTSCINGYLNPEP